MCGDRSPDIAGARGGEPSRDDCILRLRSPGHVQLADALPTFGLFLLTQKQHAEAEPILRECLDIRTAEIPDDSSRYNAMSMLGGALLGQGRYAEAEPLVLEGYEKMAPSFSAVLECLWTQAGKAHRAALPGLGKPEKAWPWEAGLQPAGKR